MTPFHCTPSGRCAAVHSTPRRASARGVTSEHHRRMDAIERLLRRQAGVVSRRQVLDAGMSEVLVARRVRRREWVRLADGVYVDHTGQLTTAQAEWATLLRHPGSVLAGRSALRAGGLRGAAGRDRARRVVEIAMPHGRRLDAEPGVSVVQLRDLDSAALPRASPPRLRVERAALMVASRALGDDEAVAILADVVREGLTVPARLEGALLGLARLPRRRLLLDVLRDVESGAESPLERRYLRDVERRHGLPRGERARAGRCSETYATRRTGRTSSWTADWATARRWTAGPTWTATSRPRRAGTRPYGSAGGRCWSRAGWPPPSAVS